MEVYMSVAEFHHTIRKAQMFAALSGAWMSIPIGGIISYLLSTKVHPPLWILAMTIISIFLILHWQIYCLRSLSRYAVTVKAVLAQFAVLLGCIATVGFVATRVHASEYMITALMIAWWFINFILGSAGHGFFSRWLNNMETLEAEYETSLASSSGANA
jgi:hypothetical protein